MQHQQRASAPPQTDTPANGGGIVAESWPVASWQPPVSTTPTRRNVVLSPAQKRCNAHAARDARAIEPRAEQDDFATKSGRAPHGPSQTRAYAMTRGDFDRPGGGNRRGAPRVVGFGW